MDIVIKRDASDEPAKKCMLCRQSCNYRLYDPETQKVCESKDVIFNENKEDHCLSDSVVEFNFFEDDQKEDAKINDDRKEQDGNEPDGITTTEGTTLKDRLERSRKIKEAFKI
ncbi:hypothetical protein Trydic_g13213 [Trypoxylus dichotomus]